MPEPSVARPNRFVAADPDELARVPTHAGALAMLGALASPQRIDEAPPWIVGGVVATSVAYERVASGDHFPTDVAVAAVMGTAIGIAVPWLHLRRGRTSVQLTPIGARGLGLTGAF